MPITRRPLSSAANAVVPQTINGSSTTSLSKIRGTVIVQSVRFRLAIKPGNAGHGEVNLALGQLVSVASSALQPTSHVNLQLRMARDHVEVGVIVKDGNAGAYSYGGDETVYQFANGLPFPPTTAVEGRGIIVVR